VKILNDSTEIMLEYLLIDVSFLDNIFIRKYDMSRSIRQNENLIKNHNFFEIKGLNKVTLLYKRRFNAAY
jgi:hypothetical protein